jgi:hypothetical protein
MLVAEVTTPEGVDRARVPGEERDLVQRRRIAASDYRVQRECTFFHERS